MSAPAQSVEADQVRLIMPGRWLCWRSNAHAHRVEPAAGLLGFGRLRIPLDEAAEFADPGFFLVERDQRLAFAELGGGDLWVAGVLLDGLRRRP